MKRFTPQNLPTIISLCLLTIAMFVLLKGSGNAAFAQDVMLGVSSAEFYTTSTLGTPTAVALKSAASNTAPLTSFLLLPLLVLATLFVTTHQKS